MNEQTVGEQRSATNDVREKDPRRVAAGKRLGAISRQKKRRNAKHNKKHFG